MAAWLLLSHNIWYKASYIVRSVCTYKRLVFCCRIILTASAPIYFLGKICERFAILLTRRVLGYTTNILWQFRNFERSRSCKNVGILYFALAPASMGQSCLLIVLVSWILHVYISFMRPIGSWTFAMIRLLLLTVTCSMVFNKQTRFENILELLKRII